MSAPSHDPGSRWVRWLLGFLLVAIALAVRIGVLVKLPGALEGDPDGYRALAENLIEYGTLGHADVPSAYRPPLYPLLLVPCVASGRCAPAAIGALHVVLGVATVWVTYRIGQIVGLGRWAVVAGLLVACDPILLGQSAQVMTETPATFLTAVGVLFLARTVRSPTLGNAAAVGAGLALAGLCRPELLLWAASVVPMVAVLVDPWAARARVLGALLVVATAVLSPWVLRNHSQLGHPIVTTTHGGYTLLLANNPVFYEHVREAPFGSVWDARELGPVWGGKAEAVDPLTEWERDRLAYDQAWNHVLQDPWMFVWSSLIRVGRLWAVLPHQGSEAVRKLVAGWCGIEYILAALGIWGICSRREDPGAVWLWGTLLVVSLSGVHAAFWSDMRMRAPLVPVIALAAAAGVAWRGRAASRRNSNEKRDLDEFVEL